MSRFLVSMLCALALAGCANANFSVNTIQVSGEEEAFPADYRARVLRYLAGPDLTGRAPAGLQISYPQTVVGATAFDARRWYVCLVGLTPPAPAPSRIKPLFEGALSGPDTAPGIYHVVLILRPGGTTTAITGFDSPLCATSRYEALSAG